MRFWQYFEADYEWSWQDVIVADSIEEAWEKFLDWKKNDSHFKFEEQISYELAEMIPNKYGVLEVATLPDGTEDYHKSHYLRMMLIGKEFYEGNEVEYDNTSFKWKPKEKV